MGVCGCSALLPQGALSAVFFVFCFFVVVSLEPRQYLQALLGEGITS